MADQDDLVGAIREAIAPMWRDTQERSSNVRDSLRKDIQASEAGVRGEIQGIGKRVDAVETRLAEIVASVERLWERQPIVVDFERFRKLEERLARLEDKLGS
jgi:hypothetical protein